MGSGDLAPNWRQIFRKAFDSVTSALKVTIAAALPAGTALIGKVGIDQTTPGTTNKVIAELTGRNLIQTQVGADVPFVFAHSAPVNNQQAATITAPASPVSEYELAIYNPSTVTDITVKLYNVEAALAGGTRDAYITSFVVPKSQLVSGTTINTYAVFVEGLFNGGNVKAVVSNNTVLGGADGFTATMRLRAVK